MNAEADSLATKIAAELRKEAQDPSNGTVVNELLRKAASAVLHSQKSWKEYRDELLQCH